MYSVEIRVMNDQGEQEGDLLSLIFDTLEEATEAARSVFETGAETGKPNVNSSVGPTVRLGRL
jgi:hypothetical protein